MEDHLHDHLRERPSDHPDVHDDFLPGDLVGDPAPAPGPTPPPVPGTGALALALDLGADDRPRHRRWGLLALGLVPWAVLGLLLLPRVAPVAAPADATPADAAPPAVVAAAPTDAALAAPEVDRVMTAAGATPVWATAGATASTQPAEVVALAVARAALGSAGPELAVDGVVGPPPGRWVEHVATERVDFPGPGLAVVTVVAVVLEADEDVYQRAVLRRLAVPVAFDGGQARPAGPPWPLPPPDLRDATPATVPVEDPATFEAVTAALDAAGYRDLVLTSVGETDGWPLVVAFRGIAPGEADTSSHRVWLRRHHDGLAVAGTAPGQGDPS